MLLVAMLAQALAEFLVAVGPCFYFGTDGIEDKVGGDSNCGHGQKNQDQHRQGGFSPQGTKVEKNYQENDIQTGVSMIFFFVFHNCVYSGAYDM